MSCAITLIKRSISNFMSIIYSNIYFYKSIPCIITLITRITIHFFIIESNRKKVLYRVFTQNFLDILNTQFIYYSYFYSSKVTICLRQMAMLSFQLFLRLAFRFAFLFLLQRRADIQGLLQSLPEAKEFARTV